MQQDAITRPIVSVGATAEGKVEPDVAVFRIRFGRRCKTQQQCADDYAQESRLVKDALAPLSLDGELKLSGYASYAHTSGRKATIDGYDYAGWGTLRVLRAEHDAAEIWSALAGCGTHASITVRFELDDERAAEDALIAQAVERARGRAEALAHAAGLALGGVKEMRYHSAGGGIRPRMLRAACAAPDEAGGEEALSFDPEPIEVSCSVDIDWWLEEARR